MTDDIVTRLREWDADPATDMKDCPFCDGVRWRGHLDHCVLKQAADEIERLRKENKAFKRLTDFLCDAAPLGTIIPEEIAKLFPDPMLKGA